MDRNFEKQEPILVTPSGEILENKPVEKEDEVFLQRTEDMATEEVDFLQEKTEGNIAEGEADPISGESRLETREMGLPMKKKIVLAFAAMTIFAGSFAGIAKADSSHHVSDSFEKGAGKIIHDVSRGAGRGMERGMEKIMTNVFGLETREQRQDRLREEKAMERRMEQEDRNYRKELERASRENDKIAMLVLKDYQNNKITKEKKDEIMKELKDRYEKMVQDINDKYGRGEKM